MDNHVTFLIRWFVVLVLAETSWGYGTTNTLAQQNDHVLYLPLTVVAPDHIQGRVTWNNDPAVNVPITLFSEGTLPDLQWTTTTNPDGTYYFTDVPSTNPTTRYRVAFHNSSALPNGQLRQWVTAEFSYTAGSRLTLNTFDVSDVVLLSPDDGATVTIPATFHWVPRPLFLSDSYQVALIDLGPFIGYWYSPELGYVNSYTFWSSAIFSPAAWSVVVHSPDGGIGSSYARTVNFSFNNIFISGSTSH